MFFQSGPSSTFFSDFEKTIFGRRPVALHHFVSCAPHHQRAAALRLPLEVFVERRVFLDRFEPIDLPFGSRVVAVERDVIKNVDCFHHFRRKKIRVAAASDLLRESHVLPFLVAPHAAGDDSENRGPTDGASGWRTVPEETFTSEGAKCPSFPS